MKNTIQSYFSETLVIATIPIISYAIAYFFEVGFLMAYNIPEYIIQISIENFFYVFIVINGLLFLIFSLVDIGTLFVHNLPENIRKNWFLFLKIPFVYMPFIVMGINGFIHHENFGWLYLAMALTFTGIMLFDYTYPAFFNQKGYLNELREMRKIDVEISKNTFSTKFAEYIGLKGFLIFMFCILTFPTTAYLGISQGYLQSKFPITDINGNNYALIRKYGETAVFIEVEKQWIDLYSYNEIKGKKFIFSQLPVGPYEVRKLK